jgi:hypothetical protein
MLRLQNMHRKLNTNTHSTSYIIKIWTSTYISSPKIKPKEPNKLNSKGRGESTLNMSAMTNTTTKSTNTMCSKGEEGKREIRENDNNGGERDGT